MAGHERVRGPNVNPLPEIGLSCLPTLVAMKLLQGWGTQFAQGDNKNQDKSKKKNIFHSGMTTKKTGQRKKQSQGRDRNRL